MRTELRELIRACRLYIQKNRLKLDYPSEFSINPQRNREAIGAVCEHALVHPECHYFSFVIECDNNFADTC